MGTVTCARCGRVGELLGDGLLPPEDWEGTIHEAVCPGCQFAEWHPHCTSLVSWKPADEDAPYPLQRVDPVVEWADMPREEWDTTALTRCEYIDLSISVTDSEAEWPHEWRCPQCGGTSFEWVHRDYEISGVHPGMFSGGVEGLEDDG